MESNCRHGENELHSGHILKVESVRFADGFDVRSERQERVKKDSKVFGLGSQKEIMIILSCPNFSAFLLLSHFFSFHL